MRESTIAEPHDVPAAGVAVPAPESLLPADDAGLLTAAQTSLLIDPRICPSIYFRRASSWSLVAV